MPDVVEAIKAELKTKQDEVIALVTKRDAEITEAGEVSKKTRDELADAVKKFEALDTDVKGEIAELRKQMNRDGLLGPDKVEYKSLGQRVVESKIHTQITEGKMRTTAPYKVEGPEDGKDALSALQHVTASRFDGEGNRIIRPAYGGVIPYLEKPLTLSAAVRRQPISTDSIEYVQQTAPFDNLRTLTVDAINGTATTFKVDNAEGFYVGQPIQIRTVDGEVERRVTAVDYTESVRTVSFSAGTGANVPARSPVTSRYFSGQIEGGLKPWSGFRNFESYTESIKTLAHGMPVTRQLLDDLPRLRAEIDSNLLSGMETNLEWQILYGNGDRRNLSGILTNPLRQTYSQSAGQHPDGKPDNKIDTVRRAITLSQIAGVAPTSLVMNIFDWEEIEMMKDDDNRYLYSTVTEGGVQRLWRTPVVVSEVLEPGRAIMGNWLEGCVLHIREGANIRFSEDYEDFFMRNMVAVLCEMRVGLTTTRPQSFVDITFDGPHA